MIPCLFPQHSRFNIRFSTTVCDCKVRICDHTVWVGGPYSWICIRVQISSFPHSPTTHADNQVISHITHIVRRHLPRQHMVRRRHRTVRLTMFLVYRNRCLHTPEYFCHRRSTERRHHKTGHWQHCKSPRGKKQCADNDVVPLWFHSRFVVVRVATAFFKVAELLGIRCSGTLERHVLPFTHIYIWNLVLSRVDAIAMQIVPLEMPTGGKRSVIGSLRSLKSMRPPLTPYWPYFQEIIMCIFICAYVCCNQAQIG